MGEPYDDEHEQNDPDAQGKPAGTDVVLEGEVMIIPRQAHDGRRNGRRQWRNNNGQGQNIFVDPDLVAQVVADRVSGMTLRDVGDKYGISHQTVANWVGEDKKNRSRIEAAEARAEAAQQLDVARGKAWEMFRRADAGGVPKVMGEALNRVESITNSKARLEGAIKPIKVDVEVYALSEAERELQAMVREAQAKAAAEEAAVIAAASEDPDL